MTRFRILFCDAQPFLMDQVLKMMGATLMFNISLHAPRDATNDAVVELLSALHEAVVVEKVHWTMGRCWW